MSHKAWGVLWAVLNFIICGAQLLMVYVYPSNALEHACLAAVAGVVFGMVVGVLVMEAV